jgi:hypothetical protein
MLKIEHFCMKAIVLLLKTACGDILEFVWVLLLINTIFKNFCSACLLSLLYKPSSYIAIAHFPFLRFWKDRLDVYGHSKGEGAFSALDQYANSNSHDFQAVLVFLRSW